MSTHAAVFVETKKGEYLGAYVHFDGYPEVCGRNFMNTPRAAALKDIVRANRGGFRSYDGPGSEAYTDTDPYHLHDPFEAVEAYVYLKPYGSRRTVCTVFCGGRLETPISVQKLLKPGAVEGAGR